MRFGIGFLTTFLLAPGLLFTCHLKPDELLVLSVVNICGIFFLFVLLMFFLNVLIKNFFFFLSLLLYIMNFFNVTFHSLLIDLVYFEVVFFSSCETDNVSLFFPF